ncbi:MAG: hypothetical protein HRU38_18580, partial [Saccharospirillaceae bacterium]|nr:Ig domain-containing protein [Pseudomonadales bacterium]NRB80643.1 hypothetical protein [Saccharospirillaceae bacterium]
MLRRLLLLTSLSVLILLPALAAEDDYKQWQNTINGELSLGDHPNQNNVVSVMDRYSISDLNDGQILQIYAQGNSLNDIYLEIRDINGLLRFSADDLELSDSFDAYIQFSFQQGDHLTISSTSPSRWQGTGSYKIYIDQPQVVLHDINLPAKFVIDQTQFELYETQSLSVLMLAQDPEYSNITYTISSNSWLSINPNSGLITGSAAATDIGEHQIIVSAFDGNSTQTQQIDVNVLRIIYSPTEINISNPYIDASLQTQLGFVALLDAIDFDSTAFTFTLEGVSFTDNQYFEIVNNKLYAKEPSNLNGSYEINIKVEDEEGLSFQQSFSLMTDVDTDKDGVMDSV